MASARRHATAETVARRHRSAQAPAVQITMEGVCIMLDEKPDWPTAKKVLGDSNFLNSLKNYDKDNIPEPTIKKLQKCAAASRIDGVVTGPRRRDAVDAAPSRGRGARHAATPSTRPPESLRASRERSRDTGVSRRCPSRTIS